jgi:DNA-binding NarL/FixJ family response regulator
MSNIRVALVDDHPVVLAGITTLLEKTDDILVVGTAATALDALRLIQEKDPDIAIIDISLPDMSGIVLTRKLLETQPGLKIITLTVHENRAYVQALLVAGIRGYVLKRAAAEDLVRAVRSVAAGGIYLDPSVAEQVLPTGPDRIGKKSGVDDLSPREESVLKSTAQGFSNKEIAARLEISIKSVETYKARASAKFNLRSRADIVRFGITSGWLENLDLKSPPEEQGLL